MTADPSVREFLASALPSPEEIERMEREIRGEEIERAKRILQGMACPARLAGYGNRLCGQEPAGWDTTGKHVNHPGSINAFCEFHLDKLHEWAGWVGRLADERKAQIIREYEEEKAAKIEADSVVYFLRVPGNRIKIGTTARLSARLNAHRKTFGSVEVLLTIKGRRETERTMHRQFGQHLVEGEREVFHAVPELLDWIAEQVAKQGARVA